MATYTVGVGGSEDYSTLEAALIVAGPGDIFNLTDAGPIPYNAGVSGEGKINDSNITIQSDPGNSSRPTVAVNTVDFYRSLWFDSANNITIKSVIFDGTSYQNYQGFINIGYSTGSIIDSCEFKNFDVTSYSLISISSNGEDIIIKNCKFVNNVCNNGTDGNILYSNGRGNNNKILNNTFYDFGAPGSTYTGTAINVEYDMLIFNNIIHGAGQPSTRGIHGQKDPAPGSLVNNYNCVYGCATAFDGYASQGANDITVDPLFKDAPGGDVTLQATSPCIDSGAGVGIDSDIPTLDYRGETRPQDITGYTNVDNGTDIGAIEMLQSEFPSTKINSFNQASAVKGQSVVSTINQSSLVDSIQNAGTDTYFDSTSEIHSVAVRYTHEGRRQRINILHRGPGLVGTASWASVARDGTWEKDRVITADAAGASNTLLRSDIGTEEDIVMTDGTMALNT